MQKRRIKIHYHKTLRLTTNFFDGALAPQILTHADRGYSLSGFRLPRSSPIYTVKVNYNENHMKIKL